MYWDVTLKVLVRNKCSVLVKGVTVTWRPALEENQKRPLRVSDLQILSCSGH